MSVELKHVESEERGGVLAFIHPDSSLSRSPPPHSPNILPLVFSPFLNPLQSPCLFLVSRAPLSIFTPPFNKSIQPCFSPFLFTSASSPIDCEHVLNRFPVKCNPGIQGSAVFGGDRDVKKQSHSVCPEPSWVGSLGFIECS